ncbi:hypothetical protein Nepgr_015049 [Nepenthes gracilis]|uniref:Pentatricopeptide repeat-containing protein n=1 Tax=Nepenthes gracilis TaxID=150966 RepID=A0AAD3SL41_NEPGR|nr:hypothetical protein Nepgr_015049 [Nepenthes gracilis]
MSTRYIPMRKMWIIRRGLNQLNLSYLLGAFLNSVSFRKTHLTKSMFSFNLDPITENLTSPLSYCNQTFSNFSTIICSNSTVPITRKVVSCDGCASEEDDDVNDSEVDVTSEGDNEPISRNLNELVLKYENFNHDVEVVRGILGCKRSNSSEAEGSNETCNVINYTSMKNKLNQCGVILTSELVVEVLSRTRNNWEAAFTFFSWAGKQPGYTPSLREYHSMISILAKRRKFDTAWALIDEMRGGRNGPSMVTPDTLLIMLRRYCALHDVGSAINTFHAFKRFDFHVGIGEFQKFLAALCRYKNVQDAEHLLFSNRNTFPFETKSFNIILNGWCNVIGSPREAKRFWRLMIEQRIKLDVVSYSSIMSSYSKSNKLKEVLWMYDKMKRMGIAPDRKVYNAVIHALAKGGLVKESVNVLKTMADNGIAPNAVTYNSLIKPLCKARRHGDAQKMFDEMLQQGLQPTIRTYHAFMRIQRTGEDIFMLMDKMKETGCPPNKDTYIMLIRKFCRWCQLENVFRLWGQMRENGLNDDTSSYVVLIHGLFLNGKLEEAYQIYLEMKERSLLPDAKTDELIQTWLANKTMAESKTVDSEVSSEEMGHAARRASVIASKFEEGRNFWKNPETRKAVKERGYSFWKQ